MKNFFFTLLSLSMFALSFSSCGKDDASPEAPELAESYFTVMLDGSTYHAEDFLAYAYDLDDHITINGVADLEANQSVVIALPKDFTVGTYSFGEESYAVALIGEVAYNTILPGGSGQVTISKYDGVNVQGTFSFTAVGGDNFELKLEATEGEFDVNLRQ